MRSVVVVALVLSVLGFQALTNYSRAEVPEPLELRRGIRVFYKQISLPAMENGNVLTNRQLLKPTEFKRLTEGMSDNDRKTWGNQPAIINQYQLATDLDLALAGVTNPYAKSEELMAQLAESKRRAGLDKKIHPILVRVWEASELENLDKLLTVEENRLAKYVHDESKAFGLLTGLITGVVATQAAATSLQNAQSQFDALQGKVKETAAAIIRNQALDLVSSGRTPALPMLAVPNSSGAGLSLDSIKVPAMAVAGMGGFLAGAQAGEMVSSIVISLVTQEDREQIANARELLRAATERSVGPMDGNQVVLSPKFIKEFSQIVGRYISIFPDESERIFFGQSIFEAYIQMCSQFDASGKVVLKHRMGRNSRGRPVSQFTAEIVDTNYDICSKLWDRLTVEHITVRSSNKYRAGEFLFQIPGMGIHMVSIGAITGGITNAAILAKNATSNLVRKAWDLPTRPLRRNTIDPHKNFSRSDNPGDLWTNNAGAEGVAFDPNAHGYLAVDLSAYLNEEKLIRSLNDKQLAFEIEVTLKRSRSPELQSRIGEVYADLMARQLKTYRDIEFYEVEMIEKIEEESMKSAERKARYAGRSKVQVVHKLDIGLVKRSVGFGLTSDLSE